MPSEFAARGRSHTVATPSIMGIVNASPESFSGDGAASRRTQADRAVDMFRLGALVVDLGGQSANTKTPELQVDEETTRLVPLIEAIREHSDGLLSVDTYKPEVAAACLEAGADIINDVSGLHHPDLADVLAAYGAGYVLMHTVGPPKSKVLEPALYDDVVRAVDDFIDEKLAFLASRGLPSRNVLVDPGLDFGKTPRQSLDVVARIGELRTDRPLLVAPSRKDFIGAITSTTPRERDPGTLAVIAAMAAPRPDSIYRVHDVAGALQFLDVLAHITDPGLLPVDSRLADELRREPIPSSAAD